MRHVFDARQSLQEVTEVNIRNDGSAPLVINTGVILGERTVRVEPGQSRSVKVALWVADSLRAKRIIR